MEVVNPKLSNISLLKKFSRSLINNQNKQNNQTDPLVSSEVEKNPKLETTTTTFTKLEFSKTNLFFKSLPNQISFDNLRIKNTGTTCIYFKWQKLIKPFNLPEKKSDGIDRFFCHYSESKLFPDEEKEFTFSFFSEKNGVFQEEWILHTSPEIRNASLVVHLSGISIHITDKYSQAIANLHSELQKNTIQTMIKEMVLDLISSIKEDPPRRPDMSDPKIFKLYFLKNNREYNVEFSSYIMRESNSVLNSIHDALGSPEEERYWNGSIDSLKSLVNYSDIGPEEKINFLFKIESLIHLGRRKYHVDSVYQVLIAEKLNEFSMDFNDLVNSVKEEMGIFPGSFDYFTRQSLTEKELNQYKNEQNKKRDEFYKKIKKKALKPEEEEKELQEYRGKIFNVVKEKLLDKIHGIDNIILDLESKIFNSYTFDEDYIDRLCRVKSLKSAKSDSIENKLIVLRIDIEDFEIIYQDIFDTNDNIIGKEIKEIVFPNAKETFLKTACSLLDNRAKAVLLLVDFGPKIGVPNPDFSVKYLKDFIEKEQLIEQTVKIIDKDALYDLQRLIDLEDNSFKENSLLLMENLNFLPEECGLELENDPFLTTEIGQVQNLKYYSKYKFTKLISLMYDDHSTPASIFVLDSYNSVMKKFPSVIDMQNEVRCLGYRLENKLSNVSTFLSIESKSALLVIGDPDDIYDSEYYDPLNSLLTINALLPRFKKIFIFGRLAMIFMHFIQNDWTMGDYEADSNYHLLIKYILIRADTTETEIIFPQDGVLLNLSEYERFKKGYKHVIQVVNEEIFDQELKDMEDEENQTIMTQKEPIIIDNYLAYVKKLFKMEKKLDEIEALKLEPEDLLEHEDYQKNKLTDEERLILEKYRNNNFEFEVEFYHKTFIQNQQTFKPKKILKNELEEREYLESVYRKPIIFKNSNESTNNGNKTLKSEMDFNNTNEVRSLTDRETIRKIIDTNENAIVDWGEKTYDKLSSLISEVKMVMWLGKLSPSPVENLYDNYSKIVRSIYERKNKLKSEYNESVQEEDKKPQDNEQKAKKYLFNIFLKSKTAYDNVRRAFLTFMLPADDKDAENHPDDDQFNYDMNQLIDISIKTECHFLDSILRGEHIPGLFGISSEVKKEKDPEIDLKFLDEIY